MTEPKWKWSHIGAVAVSTVIALLGMRNAYADPNAPGTKKAKPESARYIELARDAKTGFRAVRLTPPKDEKEALTRPSREVVMSKGKMVVLSFTKKGDPISKRQTAIINHLAPKAAKDSPNGLLIIEVPTEYYRPALLALLEQKNRLGSKGTHAPHDFDPSDGIDKGAYTVAPIPYATISNGAEYVVDITYGTYTEETSPQARFENIGDRFEYAVRSEKKRLAAIQKNDPKILDRNPTGICKSGSSSTKL